MCRYKLHHDPVCGHIATFGMESCCDVVMSMRQNESDMYCEKSNFVHDVAFENQANTCRKCVTDPNVVRTIEGSKPCKIDDLEGIDLVSDGYPFAGATFCLEGITKRALSPTRCVIHRCIPLDIALGPDFTSDDEDERQVNKKQTPSPSVAPAKPQAQSPAAGLGLEGDVKASAKKCDASVETQLQEGDPKVSDLLLSERLCQAPSGEATPAPAEPGSVYGKPWNEDIPKVKYGTPGSVDDQFMFMTGQGHKARDLAVNHDSNAGEAIDPEEAVEADFVLVLDPMDKPKVPTIDPIPSSNDEKEAKQQEKPPQLPPRPIYSGLPTYPVEKNKETKQQPQKKRPQLAPIKTDLPPYPQLDIFQITGSPVLANVLDDAISYSAPLPSPRFRFPDYTKSRSNRAECGSPRSPRYMDYIDMLGEDSPSSPSPKPPKRAKVYFQPPPNSPEMPNGQDSSPLDFESFEGVKRTEIDELDQGPYGREVSAFSDDSDSEDGNEYTITSDSEDDDDNTALLQRSSLFGSPNRIIWNSDINSEADQDTQKPAAQNNQFLYAPQAPQPMRGWNVNTLANLVTRTSATKLSTFTDVNDHSTGFNQHNAADPFWDPFEPPVRRSRFTSPPGLDPVPRYKQEPASATTTPPTTPTEDFYAENQAAAPIKKEPWIPHRYRISRELKSKEEGGVRLPRPRTPSPPVFARSRARKSGLANTRGEKFGRYHPYL